MKKIQALGTETPIKLHTVCRISYSGIVGCPAADRRKWASIKKSNNSKFLRKAQEKDFWNSNLLKDKIRGCDKIHPNKKGSAPDHLVRGRAFRVIIFLQ